MIYAAEQIGEAANVFPVKGVQNGIKNAKGGDCVWFTAEAEKASILLTRCLIKIDRYLDR